jgi:hypothetical protein
MEGSCHNGKFNDERHSSENYIRVHSGMALADSSGSSGSYQIGCLNRYGQEAFTPKFSGSGGVSLTWDFNTLMVYHYLELNKDAFPAKEGIMGLEVSLMIIVILVRLQLLMLQMFMRAST